MRRIPMIDGDEVDTFTRKGRAWTANNHGKRATVKRRYRRRERHQGRQETREAYQEAIAGAWRDSVAPRASLAAQAIIEAGIAIDEVAAALAEMRQNDRGD